MWSIEKNKEGISMNQCPQQKSKRFQINYHKKYQNKNKLSPKSVEGKKIVMIREDINQIEPKE